MYDTIAQMVASTATATPNPLLLVLFSLGGLAVLGFIGYVMGHLMQFRSASTARKAADRLAMYLSYAEASTHFRSSSKNALVRLFALKKRFKKLLEKLRHSEDFGATPAEWEELANKADADAREARRLEIAARDEADFARLAAKTRLRAEQALAPYKDNDSYEFQLLRERLARASQLERQGSFQRAYDLSRLIAPMLEFSVEEAHLSKKFAELLADPKTRQDRAIIETTKVHLGKARQFLQSEDTFRLARIQLTCARLKIDFLVESSAEK